MEGATGQHLDPDRPGSRADAARLRSARRWWKSVSRTMQPTAPVLTEHVERRLAGLGDAWERKCVETSELVTTFVASLREVDLAEAAVDDRSRVAEKLRWRELRALLVSHLASEIGERAELSARPLLDELERIGLFDHRPALLAGDLRGFDEYCAASMPSEVVPGAYSSLVRGLDERSAAPVDAFLVQLGLPAVDDELRGLLDAADAAVTARLDRAMSLRPRLVTEPVRVDLTSDEPVVQLPAPARVEVGEPPWNLSDAADA